MLIGDTGSTRGILFQVLARNSTWTKVKVERRVDCKVEQSRTQFKVEQNPKIPTASLSASKTPAADKGCNIVKGTKVNNSKMKKGRRANPQRQKIAIGTTDQRVWCSNCFEGKGKKNGKFHEFCH